MNSEGHDYSVVRSNFLPGNARGNSNLVRQLVQTLGFHVSAVGAVGRWGDRISFQSNCQYINPLFTQGLELCVNFTYVVPNNVGGVVTLLQPPIQLENVEHSLLSPYSLGKIFWRCLENFYPPLSFCVEHRREGVGEGIM